MKIKGLEFADTKERKECVNNIVSNREETEKEIAELINTSKIDIETKKLISKITAKLILYTQENTSAIYNCCKKEEK